MTTLALYHLKGGVGKTAAAVNLAYLAARTGAPTLLVDLDPQSSATYYFRVKPRLHEGAKLLIKNRKTVLNHIRATEFEDLDLLPADQNLRKMDSFLASQKKPLTVIKDFLAPLKKDYEYIFLDCPPTLSLVAEAIFAATDVLLTPVIPTFLSARTHTQLAKFLEKKRFKPLRWYSFISMMDGRKTLHRDFMASLRQDESLFLRSIIPFLSDVERMGIYRQPLPCFNPNSEASYAYRRLWWEIEGRISQTTPAP